MRASQLCEEIKRNPTSLALHLKFEEALGLLAEHQKEIIAEQAKQIEELSKVIFISLIYQLILAQTNRRAVASRKRTERSEKTGRLISKLQKESNTISSLERLVEHFWQLLMYQAQLLGECRRFRCHNSK